MSLFRVKEAWAAQCGSGEEFHFHSLCVGCVDNSASGQERLVTGSLQGYLRVFAAPDRGFRPENLLLEARARVAPSSPPCPPRRRSALEPRCRFGARALCAHTCCFSPFPCASRRRRRARTQLKLGQPVLQLECGAFLEPGRLALAVLHPRQLSVFELVAQVLARSLAATAAAAARLERRPAAPAVSARTHPSPLRARRRRARTPPTSL